MSTKLYSKYLKYFSFSTTGALICNLLLVYFCFFVCRLAFLLVNLDVFSPRLNVSSFFEMFWAGSSVFDTSAILYMNVVFLFLFLFPFHWKEKNLFYNILRILYTFVNLTGVVANLVDCVYFRYSGRRTTASVFQEFAHEDAGNLGSVIGIEIVHRWYLLLLAIILGTVLYKGFRTPSKRYADRKLRYYLLQTVCLLVAIPLTVFGMRGGTTRATRPITVSNANQYADKPADATLVLNTPFAVFRTFGKKPFIVPHYLSEDQSAGLYSPLHVPADDSAHFRPMNAVVLIVESFGTEYIGGFNSDKENGQYKGFTPFVDSLLPHCLSFKYSYSNGRKSIDGMPSVLSSIPMFVEPFFLTAAAMNDVSSIAGELTRYKGYYSAFFHGAKNGSMGFQAFARSAGFVDYFGRSEYNADSRYGGDNDFDGAWAIWDEEFLQFFCDKMNEFQQPFVTSVFTASSHHPFTVPEKYAERFTEGHLPIHKTIKYTDYALQRFFEKASRQPWFDNTVFVITADHPNQRYIPEYMTDLGCFTVPVLFYAPSMPEINGYNTETIAGQIDIMPTLLGMLGYERPYIAFGQDLLHTPVDVKFTVNYIEGIYQFLQGDLLLLFDGDKVKSVYRFKEDTGLQNDIKNELPETELTALTNRLKAIIQQYMERMNTNRLTVQQTDSTTK